MIQVLDEIMRIYAMPLLTIVTLTAYKVPMLSKIQFVAKVAFVNFISILKMYYSKN